MTKKRYGKFVIDRHMLETDDKQKLVSSLLTWMGFIPTRCEYLAHKAQFEYIGLSHLFDEVTLGDTLPEYNLVIARMGTAGRVDFECTRISN